MPVKEERIIFIRIIGKKWLCHVVSLNYNFYFSGLQNQNVVYYQTTLKPSEERKVFLDPNQLSSDGTVSLQFLVFSQDGSKAALGLSKISIYFYIKRLILN